VKVSRTLRAATVIAAPLAGLMWSLFVPVFRGSMAGEVDAIASSPDRFVNATYTGVLMSFLMIPAALSIARLLAANAPRASWISGITMAIGACFHGAVLVFQLAEAGIIAAVPDHAVATTIVSRLFEQRSFAMVLAPFFLFYIGLAALSVIILVKSSIPKWTGLLILIGIVIELASPIPVKARIFFVCLTVAFAFLSWRIVKSEP
jgi:hypothetical protein